MRSLLAGAVLGLVVLVPAVPASSSPVAPTRLWVLDDITVNKPAVPTSGNFGFNLPMYPKEWVLKWSYSTCVTGASGKAWFDMEVVAEGAQPGTPNHDLGYLAQTGSRRP